MARKAPTKRVDRDHAARYLTKARDLVADATNQVELIAEFHPVSIGITIVHSAISYCDAVCIKAAGTKSRSGEHRDVVALVKSVLRTGAADAQPLKDLAYLIGMKDEIAYGDATFRNEEAKDWLGRLRRVAASAEKRFAGLA